MNTQITYKQNEVALFPIVALEPVWYGKRTPTRFASHKAVVDQEDGSVLAVVSDRYQLIRHEDLIAIIEEAFGNYNLGFERAITFIKQGAKMIATYTIPSMSFRLGKADIINPTIIVKNSYDQSWVASMIGGIYRLLCSNGAYIGTMFSKFKQRHLFSLTLESITSRIDRLADGFEGYATAYQRMRATPLTADRLNFLNKFDLNVSETRILTTMREKTSGLIIDMQQIPETEDTPARTAWIPRVTTQYTEADGFNLLTEFATHQVPNALRQDDLYEKINRAMLV